MSGDNGRGKGGECRCEWLGQLNIDGEGVDDGKCHGGAVNDKITTTHGIGFGIEDTVESKFDIGSRKGMSVMPGDIGFEFKSVSQTVVEYVVSGGQIGFEL